MIQGLLLQGISHVALMLGILIESKLFIILGTYLYVLSFGFSSGGILFSYTADFVPQIGLSIAGAA